MNRIDKIFVGGQIHSGKNILWRLLDGHPEIVSNCMHSNIGWFVLSDNCKERFLRTGSAIDTKTHPFIPMCKIVYSTGEETAVAIGDFIRALYTYTSYHAFYSWAKGNSMFVNMKEGENERFPFAFDIDGFEKKLEQVLFTDGVVFTEEDVLDVIYSSYIDSLGDEGSIVGMSGDKRHFVDTLPNGIGAIKTVATKVPSAKIIVLRRDAASLLYANAGRIMSARSEVEINNTFKKILYNQKMFEKKIRGFDNEATELQTSHNNILVVDFNDLILDVENTMKDVANFLGIQFDPILSLPSINGEVIDNDKFPILGKINDDPYTYLSKSEAELLKYCIYGYDKQYSIAKKISIFVQAIKWRHLTKLEMMISPVIRKLLPTSIFLQLRNIYKGV